MAQAADEEAEPDDGAEDDHRHRHHRIARDRRMISGTQQDRGDEDDLDEADGDRQHQRPIRIAEAAGQVLGLVHDSERTDEDDRDDDDERGDEQGAGAGGSRR